MEELELVKENVLPLRRGRALPPPGAAAATEGPDPGRATKLEEERRAFQAELAAHDCDDPLAVWLQYITWTQTHYPAGGPASQLLATLESCTRELLSVARYKDDIRYLRVWVQYADCCSEPKEIFDFLEHHEIGQDFALFYEARATFLELRGNFPLAHAAYESGLNRQAQPLQRLKSKFASFEARMALRLQRKLADEALGIREADEPSARDVLVNRPAAVANTQRAAPRAITNVMEARLGQKRASENSRCGDFEIFQDEGAAAGENAGRHGAPVAAAKWGNLGSQADGRKENTQAAAAWNTARVPLSRAALRPAAAFVLDVYEDEDFSDAAPAPAPAPAAHVPLRKRLDDEATDLHYNPLLNHSAPAAAAAKLPSAAAAAPAPALVRLPMKEPGQPLDVASVCWLSDALLSSRTTHTESSFEEARASFWLQRYSPPSAAEVAAAAAPSAMLMPVDVAPSEPAPCAVAPLPAAVAPLPTPVKLTQPAASSPRMLAQAALVVEEMQPALQEAPVMAFAAPRNFCDPPRRLDADAAPSAPKFSVTAADDQNMTTNLRDAYTDIMSMFSNALPPQQGARKKPCNASSSVAKSGFATAAHAEPAAFEIYQEDEDHSPLGSPTDLGFSGPIAQQPSAFQQEAFVPEGLQPCFEDDEMVEQYAPNGENCDPLPPHDELARPAAPARSSVDGAALQPLSPAFYAASVSDGVEDDVDADAAERVLDAEAALRDASSAEALAAQDSFKVYEDEEPETCASVEPAAFTLEAAGTAAPAAPAALVDAFSPAALEHNMASLEEPVAVMQGVTVEDESTAAKLEASLSAARRHPHSGVVLQLGGYRYIMGKLCGRGAFADIYEAVDEDDADSGDEGHAPAPALALKVVRPPDAVAVSWEFVVLRRVAARVAPLERQLFLQARRLHMAGPHSVLVAPFGSHGTLQDAVNAAMGTDRVGAMHESLAMYFTVELLRCLEVLHAAGFIHADVKPDNVLLRNGGAAWEEWTPDRPGDWRLRGLALIDFGRSIDLTTHVPGTAFVGDCGTDNFRCIEMQTHAPWTFQADTFGALGCVHAMLWGSYMDVDCDTGSGRWRRRASMKRYWHAELWEPLFDALLNVPSCDAQPPLSSFRAAFEAHLAAPERALEVRAQLMELTILMHEQAAKAAK